MRKALLIGTAVSALTATSAFAADLPTRKAPPAPIVVVPFTWTGCYVGAEGGFGWGKEKDNFDYPLYYLPGTETIAPATSAASGGALTNAPISFASQDFPVIGASVGGGGFNASGAKIGGRAGCNYQYNQFVIGGVVDFEWSGIRGSKNTLWPVTVYNANLEGVSANGLSHLSLQNDWQGSIRGNVGWAFDRLLIYATGGAAFAEIKSSWAVSDPCSGGLPGFGNPYSCEIYSSSVSGSGYPYFPWLGGSQSKTVWGWTLGGGVEYAIDNHWSVLGEVRYVSFEHVNVSLPLSFYQSRLGVSGSGEYGLFGYNASFNEILAQVGVDYRF